MLFGLRHLLRSRTRSKEKFSDTSNLRNRKLGGCFCFAASRYRRRASGVPRLGEQQSRHDEASSLLDILVLQARCRLGRTRPDEEGGFRCVARCGKRARAGKTQNGLMSELRHACQLRAKPSNKFMYVASNVSSARRASALGMPYTTSDLTDTSEKKRSA